MFVVVEFGQVTLFKMWIVGKAGVGGTVGGWAESICGKAIPKTEIMPNPNNMPNRSL